MSLHGCIVTIGGRLEKLAEPSSTCLLGVTDDLFGLRVPLIFLSPDSIDAIGCFYEIVKLIAQQEADYVITLKKNQGSLYKRVEALFSAGTKK